MPVTEPPTWDPHQTPPDLAVLFGLREEFGVLAKLVDLRAIPNEKFGGDDYAFELESEAGEPYHCIAAFAGDFGEMEPATQRLLEWRPACLASVGIAMSIDRQSLKAGDLLAVKSVQAYEYKNTDRIERTGTITKPNLVRLAEHFEFSHPQRAWITA